MDSAFLMFFTITKRTKMMMMMVMTTTTTTIMMMMMMMMAIIIIIIIILIITELFVSGRIEAFMSSALDSSFYYFRLRIFIGRLFFHVLVASPPAWYLSFNTGSGTNC